jgi:hypothetical protein
LATDSGLTWPPIPVTWPLILVTWPLILVTWPLMPATWPPIPVTWPSTGAPGGGRRLCGALRMREEIFHRPAHLVNERPGG